MMRVLLLEWMVAEGIIGYRAWKKNGHAPLPGQMLAASGVFVLLALLAETSPDAAKLATTLGGGFVMAAGFNLFAKLGQTSAKTTASLTGPGAHQTSTGPVLA